MENLLESSQLTQIERIRIERVNSIIDDLRRKNKSIGIHIISIGFSNFVLSFDTFIVSEPYLKCLYERGCRIVELEITTPNDYSPFPCLLLKLEY